MKLTQAKKRAEIHALAVKLSLNDTVDTSWYIRVSGSGKDMYDAGDGALYHTALARRGTADTTTSGLG